MKYFFLICILTLGPCLLQARTWTDTEDQTFEAKVVWVKADKRVKLKTDSGKIMTRPFSTFVPQDIRYLENLLTRKTRGKLHPVPWSEMNALFGSDIWNDENLWDDSTAAVAERMKLKKETKTAFMENHRAYPLGEENLLQEPIYTTVLYGKEECTDSLSFVFLNLGDLPGETEYSTPDSIEELTEKIEASGMRVHDTLVPVLGKPRRDTIGKGNMREKVWRWDWNQHAIMLVMKEGKYATLRVLPSARADRSGKVEKIHSRELRDRMRSCVERCTNGDVIINNIPMIDQGPKGYCSPATWERYLRYLGIPADMYQLAIVANTGVGGGTYSHDIINATSGLLSANGRRVEDVDDEMETDVISKYIDQGMPIMWSFGSTSSFQRTVNNNTARRNGTVIDEDEEYNENQSTAVGGHICLIMGYNEQTSEIAISDSWGPEYAARWVHIDKAASLTYGEMRIIKW